MDDLESVPLEKRAVHYELEGLDRFNDLEVLSRDAFIAISSAVENSSPQIATDANVLYDQLLDQTLLAINESDGNLETNRRSKIKAHYSKADVIHKPLLRWATGAYESIGSAITRNLNFGLPGGIQVQFDRYLLQAVIGRELAGYLVSSPSKFAFDNMIFGLQKKMTTENTLNAFYWGNDESRSEDCMSFHLERSPYKSIRKYVQGLLYQDRAQEVLRTMGKLRREAPMFLAPNEGWVYTLANVEAESFGPTHSVVTISK